MKNKCGMKVVRIFGLGIALTLWGGSPVAQGDLTLSGLECYLDFTVAPLPADPGGDPNNPDPNSLPTVIDQTGNGNNGTLHSESDPDGGGPATGVPTFDGSGIRLFGGWINVDPSGSLNTLSSGTLELIYDDMPIINNSISTGTPLSVANPGNAAGGGRSDDWELWVDHRTLANRGFSFNGRVGGVDQFGAGVTHHMTAVDTEQREQHFVQWDGVSKQARLVSRFYKDGVLTVGTSSWESTGTMPDFLSAATNVRVGGRHYEEPYYSTNASESPYYRTSARILRVYNRVLTDAEMLDNWNAYSTPIPTPTTCQQVIDLGHGIASDLTGDCFVNLEDFGVMASDWTRCVDPSDVSCEKPWENF